MGDKKIGVSLSDPTLSIAQGLKLYRRASLEEDLEEFKRIVKENEVGEIVIGLPRDLSGKIGNRAKNVMGFAEKIRESVDIPVNLWDERFSTNEAHRIFDMAEVRHKKRKPYLDIMASQIILQGYLDARSTR
ncbi:MAG: Holliday junction resolvase RuvX [Syntrophorhabdaceae bacterium]|nr:Holliday junction resolvase RuvX [Syntrophorhabdaceae bacterium]HOC45833.1 Holliday junction resolvase RuvX [Syntrophorhabdaceae bacterium]